MKDDINLLITKLFHSIYVNKNFVRPISERRWCKMLNFEYKSYSFQQIYIKKVKHQKVSKFAEFNYKLLHNNYYTISVNKWNKHISKDCEYCLEIEDIEHKIFNCKLVKPIWNKFELCFKCCSTFNIIALGYQFGNLNTVCIEECINILTLSMNNYKIKCRTKEIYPSNEGLINHIKFDIKFLH